MPAISFDWVWFGNSRDGFLSLSDVNQEDLLLRVAFISANPWPDFSSKRFFDDLPLKSGENVPGQGAIGT